MIIKKIIYGIFSGFFLGLVLGFGMPGIYGQVFSPAFLDTTNYVLIALGGFIIFFTFGFIFAFKKPEIFEKLFTVFIKAAPLLQPSGSARLVQKSAISNINDENLQQTILKTPVIIFLIIVLVCIYLAFTPYIYIVPYLFSFSLILLPIVIWLIRKFPKDKQNDEQI